MGNYREQYEKYYGNVKMNGGAASYKRAVAPYSGGPVETKNRGSNFAEKLVKKFIMQAAGAALLLTTVAAIKYIPVEGTDNNFINQAKNAISGDINVREAVMYLDIPDGEGYKEKALDYIDKIKASASGQKTLKQLIKDDYIQPVKGKIKYINGDSKGIAISVDNTEDVISAYGGTVEEVRDEEDNKCILINHGNGTETYYGSLSEVDVEAGSIIAKGETIGKCGKIDSTDKEGVIFKFIYFGSEKSPSDMMNLSALEEV